MPGLPSQDLYPKHRSKRIITKVILSSGTVEVYLVDPKPMTSQSCTFQQLTFYPKQKDGSEKVAAEAAEIVRTMVAVLYGP